MFIDYYSSSIGLIKMIADDKGLTSLSIVHKEDPDSNGNALLTEVKTQLELYFSGQIQEFDIPLNMEAGSEFYQKVWKELLTIPYGRTVSYLDIAKNLGDPNSTRAVGMANGKNPIAIIVPCHRVIGSDGSLTGYAYGPEVKRSLLALENPNEYAINGTLF